MDNNNQPSQVSNIKKLAIPALFLVGGLLIVGVLFKTFIVDSKLLDAKTAAELQAQDAFQAPAEMSTALQIECQASVEKIDKSTNCEEQESEFFTKSGNCLSYSFAIEKPKQLATEGQFGDLIFNIARCYQNQNPPNLAAATQALKKAKDLPPWEVSMGAVTCDSQATLNAYIDSYSPSSQFSCVKADALNTFVASLQSKDLGFLSTLLWSQHIPQLGLKDSDVFCPENLKNISTSLQKILSQSVTINLSQSDENKTPGTTYLEFTKGSDQIALLKLATTPEGCLYLHSLLTVESTE